MTYRCSKCLGSACELHSPQRREPPWKLFRFIQLVFHHLRKASDIILIAAEALKKHRRIRAIHLAKSVSCKKLRSARHQINPAASALTDIFDDSLQKSGPQTAAAKRRLERDTVYDVFALANRQRDVYKRQLST